MSADFRNITFANCDLRGTMFEDCVFDGVDMVNCLLDGAMFDRCEFSGTLGPAQEPKWLLDPSRFELSTTGDRDAYTLDSLVRYCGFGQQGIAYSASAGMPLLPLEARARLGDTVRATRFERTSGGLGIYGGRISSLTVRGCTFRRDADKPGPVLALRHVGGTGLAFVEQAGPVSMQVHASAIRHVVFSSIDQPSQSIPLDVEVSGTVMLQSWISTSFSGCVRASDSRVAQFWNASPDLEVVFDAASNVVDVVGGRLKDATDMGFQIGGSSTVFPVVEDVERVARVVPTMDEVDYRQAPQLRFFRDLEPFPSTTAQGAT